MFSGIGGMEYGIQNSRSFLQGSPSEDIQGLPSITQRQTGATCIGYSEINKYAIQIYRRWFKEGDNYGDATKIVAEGLPDFDLLVGGFPCQAFSIAGRRFGFDDTRGTLFFDIARILKAKQPRNFLLENVDGLLFHDKGRTFRTIIATLTELGYCVEWQVLNSKNFGVPQSRKRVFIIGHLGRGCKQQVFPIGEFDEKGDREFAREAQNAHTLKACYGSAKGGDDYVAVAPVARVMQVGTYRTHKDGRGFREVKQGVAPALPARAREDGSGQPVVFDGNIKIRRLTPVECERLQGFPDGWTAKGIDDDGNEIVISDSQRYKCLGNAVTVNVVAEIIKELYGNRVWA